MKGKKSIAFIMSLVTLSGVAGCGTIGNQGGTVGDGDDVIINVSIQDLGYGTQWLEESCKRFEDLNKNTDYGNGKVGVAFRYIKGTPEQPSSLATSGTHIVFNVGRASDLAASGQLLNLDEIVKEKYDNGKSIEDKMYDEAKQSYKGNDGSYYTIPTHEVYTGMSYDKDLFDRYGLYFAKPDAEFSAVNPYTSSVTGRDVIFLNSNIANWEQNKSCGPDGEYGTSDDGLPSSLMELLELWDIMKQEYQVYPIQLAGKYVNYSNCFMDGLWGSLAGAEKAYTSYTFDGQVDVVTTFEPQSAFGSNKLSYVSTPVTQTVDVTEESGFYTTWSVERYYAMAALEVIYKEGWFAPGSNTVGGISHTDAQKKFLFSGYDDVTGTNDEVGCLMEGSYWYNESNIRGNLASFEYANPGVTRNVRWMPMPVNIMNSVTGEDTTATLNGVTESVKGEKNVLVRDHNNIMYFNKIVKNDASVYKAVKDWIQFFNSDEELNKVTVSQGFRKALNYELKPEYRAQIAGFYADLFDLAENSYVLLPEGSNKTYEANSGTTGLLVKGLNSGYFKCHNGYYFLCLETRKNGAREGFESTMITKDNWKSFYQGSNPNGIDFVNNVTYNKPDTELWG